MTNRTTINYKKEHGPALFEAGYALVPIKRGEKHPGSKKWTEIEVDAQQLEQWIKSSYYGGLGCLGRLTPGIDIDVYDKEIVDKLVNWCQEHIGVTPIRTGNAPRVLLPCSAPEAGIGPDNSPKYECDLGNLHQIEIKATGQQWVAYGVHPDTGNPYTWEGGELHEHEAEFLPILTGEKIQALFDFFESVVPDDWEVKSRGRSRSRKGGLAVDGTVTGDSFFENYTPPLNISADKIVQMLDLLDPDGEVNGCGWRTVGMALFHQFEGSDEGKEIFRAWSESSVDYDLDEIDARWPSFGADTYRGRPTTAATIVSMYNAVAEARGADDPTLRRKSKLLSDWVKRFAIVELKDGTEVHDRGVPIHRSPRRSLKAFREHNSAYTHTFVNMDGEAKTELMVDVWRSSHDTRHYAGYIYNPGAGRYCANPAAIDDDAVFVNTFYFPPHPEVEDESRLIPFFKFLEHLFPEKVEREWFVEWLGRLIQHPDTRSFVTPINVTPVTGTGRGLLFEILRQVVGGHNTHDVSKDDMEGRFNGFLDKCILAVVQEIKAATGDHKYQMWERMKSLLADTSANIQQKGVDSYTAPVYANFLMFSNNIDALPIDDINERRIYAMRGADSPITNKMIDSVNHWREDKDNIAALFDYLKGVKVNPRNFKRAPVSETKRQMVTASLGEDGDTLVSWLTDEAPEVFTFQYAIDAIAAYSGDTGDFDSFGTSKRAFGRSLADRGYHSRQIRNEHGERVRVWYNPGKSGDDTKTLKRLLNRPREL